MILKDDGAAGRRELRTERLEADLVIVGGGMAGTCAAITAARQGVRVVLVQDRPVLGGNASSEVRLWTLGATSHMSNNNRWAREGGVIDELMVENLWRNRDGNPLVWDTVLLEKVISEPNITLLLNTAVYEVTKDDNEPDTIAAVTAICSQNSTRYEIAAPLFCDASGDGIVGFLAGAAFRMGAEAAGEFGEKFAPSQEYGELLGHSIYFYSKDVGKPVRFVAPSYALKDVEGEIPRFRNFQAKQYGCKLWWLEYGGRLDTVHDTEKIKWELWRVVYGVWDYIKNSGRYPREEVENLTLEWVGAIPGKRESRRFEGDYMLTQRDLVEQRSFEDAVAFGGWSIDLHPADGIFSEKPGCAQWHSRGVFQIPYRSLYSRNLKNLFLAGRIISASHVAFGATRVMATCAHAAQAVGVAAAHCLRDDLHPRDIAADTNRLKDFQRDLLRTGQHIPGFRLEDEEDLARTAKLTASSHCRLREFTPDGPVVPLNVPRAQMLPVLGRVPATTLTLDVAEKTTLHAELRASDRCPDAVTWANHTPDAILAEVTIPLDPGENQRVEIDFGPAAVSVLSRPGYVFLALRANSAVSVHTTEQRLTGVLSLRNHRNQTPRQDIGVESFEFWSPDRRPDGQNFALSLSEELEVFRPENITSGLDRPVGQPNAWVADPTDPLPALTLRWTAPQTIGRLILSFDTDWDHPMEPVLWGHPEDALPFCIRHVRVRDAAGAVLWEDTDNHQTRREIALTAPITTDGVTIECLSTHGGANVPAALFGIRCYAR